MQFLQANTATIVRVGPFVDVGDGFTPETGVTLSGADEAEVMKAGGGASVSISGNTWAAVTGCDGWYDLTLTAGNLDTEGTLTVVVQDDDVCLPVFIHFMVIAQSAFASLITAKDTGFMDVNVKAVSEDTTAADNLESACDNYSATRGLSGTALPAAAAGAAGGIPTDSTGKTSFNDPSAAAIQAEMEENGASILDSISDKLPTNYIMGSSVQTDKDDEIDAIKAVTDNLPNSGALTDIDTGVNNIEAKLPSKNYLTGTANTDGDIQADEATGNFPGSVASVAGAVGSVTGNVGGNVTGTIGELAAQAKADVNAEVSDVINTDALTEPGQGAPAWSISLSAMIRYLYKGWRNKIVQDSTSYELYNDAGDTVDQKATISDDGTDFTKGEIGSGP